MKQGGNGRWITYKRIPFLCLLQLIHLFKHISIEIMWIKKTTVPFSFVLVFSYKRFTSATIQSFTILLCTCKARIDNILRGAWVSEWLKSLTSKPHVYTTDMASSPYYRSQVLGFADTFARPWVSLITSLYVQIFFPDKSDNHNIAESDDRHQ